MYISQLKARHLIAYLMVFVMLSMVFAVYPAAADNKSTDDYEAADSLQVYIGYTGTRDDNNKIIYNEFKTISSSEMEAMKERHVYSIIDNLPCTVVDPAEGVPLTKLLDKLGIDASYVSHFGFWAADVPGQAYVYLSKEYLLDTERYYFPDFTMNWDISNGLINSGDGEIYFPDSVAAMAYKKEVPTMLAIRDNFQRVFPGERGDTSYNNLTDAVKYRLLFGKTDDLDSSAPEHTASRTVKWIYRIDITLKGTAEKLGIGGSKTDIVAMSINPPVLTIKPEATYQLKATVEPATASQVVTWESSDTTIATVSATGVLTTFVEGTVDITATAADKSTKATCKVTVTHDAIDLPPAEDPDAAGNASDVDNLNNGVPIDVNLTDIAGHWAESNIRSMVARGAVTGYPDNTFRPNNTITRAEFIAIVIKAFNIQEPGEKVFGDTDSHWAKSAISTAVASGIASGYNEQTFGPNDPVTREQMAAMIVKAANIAQDSAVQANFADSDSISKWAQNSVNLVVSNELMGGYPDNTFKPQGKATRAEAVSVIAKALNR